MEDHAATGGFGSAVLEALQEAGSPVALERIGWPDRFIEHGSNVDDLRAAHGLAPETLYRRILDRWHNLSAERIEIGT
jgi:1-deoxy-D-xylulose-5-phosphate synthase